MIRVDTAHRVLAFDGLFCPCVIGKGGTCDPADKREGDGKTPLGEWTVRGALLRPDRIAPAQAPKLPWRWLRPDDGWCDDPADPLYNRPVRLPRATSHERLWREDQAYDVIIMLGHNDAPPVPGMGSAIFFHQWVIGEGGEPNATEGCVAIDPEAMRAILPILEAGIVVQTG